MASTNSLRNADKNQNILTIFYLASYITKPDLLLLCSS